MRVFCLERANFYLSNFSSLFVTPNIVAFLAKFYFGYLNYEWNPFAYNSNPSSSRQNCFHHALQHSQICNEQNFSNSFSMIFPAYYSLTYQYLQMSCSQAKRPNYLNVDWTSGLRTFKIQQKIRNASEVLLRNSRLYFLCSTHFDALKSCASSISQSSRA